MKKPFRATRSFFGDLGNFRRNQVVELDPTDKTVKELITKELLSEDTNVPDRRAKAPASTEPSDQKLEDLTIDQLKALAAEKQIDLGDAKKHAEIVAVIEKAQTPAT